MSGMIRKRPAAGPPPSVTPAQRHALQRQLVQCSTQTGLLQTLGALHDAGVLSCDLALKPRQLAKELTQAKKKHSEQETPYGRVVQQMDLPSDKLPNWDYCHPAAFTWYLASLSMPFFEIMTEASMSCARAALNVIVYIDELVPGNVNRHDDGRKFHAVYWALAEWPAWLLSRTGAWPVFGVLRSRVVKTLPGGPAQLMKFVLHAFFGPGNPMTTGIVLTSSDGRSTFVKFQFWGVLGDEKGLKEVWDYKGASGTLRRSFQYYIE